MSKLYYDRITPDRYARRLIQELGVEKAERVIKKGTDVFGKEHQGWWPAAYDAVQTIKWSGTVRRNRYQRTKRRPRRYRRNYHGPREVSPGVMRIEDKRGNTTDRKRRREYIMKTFGTGRTCPCKYCGRTLTKKTMEVDRVIPGFAGGTYRRENCVPSCRKCNIDRYHKEGYGHSVGYKNNPRYKHNRRGRRYARRRAYA